jgi:hypothetical protein
MLRFVAGHCIRCAAVAELERRSGDPALGTPAGAATRPATLRLSFTFDFEVFGSNFCFTRHISQQLAQATDGTEASATHPPTLLFRRAVSPIAQELSTKTFGFCSGSTHGVAVSSGESAPTHAAPLAPQAVRLPQQAVGPYRTGSCLLVRSHSSRRLARGARTLAAPGLLRRGAAAMASRPPILLPKSRAGSVQVHGESRSQRLERAQVGPAGGRRSGIPRRRAALVQRARTPLQRYRMGSRGARPAPCAAAA